MPIDISALTNGLWTLEFARRMTLALYEDFPPNQVCYQPFPGANHALWIAGHLAWDDNFFLTTLGGRKTDFPAAWNPLFGTGSLARPDPSAYPALPQVMQQLYRRREELMAWFQSLDADQLASPLPKEHDTFAQNYATLMPSVAWHEGVHAGQLIVIRKVLGMKPRFA